MHNVASYVGADLCVCPLFHEEALRADTQVCPCDTHLNFIIQGASRELPLLLIFSARLVVPFRLGPQHCPVNNQLTRCGGAPYSYGMVCSKAVQ